MTVVASFMRTGDCGALRNQASASVDIETENIFINTTTPFLPGSRKLLPPVTGKKVESITAENPSRRFSLVTFCDLQPVPNEDRRLNACRKRKGAPLRRFGPSSL